MTTTSFLAPIPKQHFESALDVLKTKDFVLFGSDAYDFFANVESGSTVLLYLSHDEAEPEVRYEASYRGYVGDPMEMRHLEADGYRPSTAKGEKWAFFWKLSDIQKLPDPIKLSDIKTKNGKYLASFPRGPIAII